MNQEQGYLWISESLDTVECKSQEGSEACLGFRQNFTCMFKGSIHKVLCYILGLNFQLIMYSLKIVIRKKFTAVWN